MAYLPKHKLLFKRDLFGPPLVDSRTANDFAVELLDGIRKRNLQVETFAGAHGAWRPFPSSSNPSRCGRSELRQCSPEERSDEGSPETQGSFASLR